MLCWLLQVACSFLLPLALATLCFLPLRWAVLSLALSSRCLHAGAALDPFCFSMSPWSLLSKLLPLLGEAWQADPAQGYTCE